MLEVQNLLKLLPDTADSKAAYLNVATLGYQTGRVEGQVVSARCRVWSR